MAGASTGWGAGWWRCCCRGCASRPLQAPQAARPTTVDRTPTPRRRTTAVCRAQPPTAFQSPTFPQPHDHPLPNHTNARQARSSSAPKRSVGPCDANTPCPPSTLVVLAPLAVLLGLEPTRVRATNECHHTTAKPTQPPACTVSICCPPCGWLPLLSLCLAHSHAVNELDRSHGALIALPPPPTITHTTKAASPLAHTEARTAGRLPSPPLSLHPAVLVPTSALPVRLAPGWLVELPTSGQHKPRAQCQQHACGRLA